MKNQKSYRIALAVLAVCVLLSVVVGQRHKGNYQETGSGDAPLSTQAVEAFVLDETGALDDSTVKRVDQYNANWLDRYDSILALAVVSQPLGDLGQLAEDLANEMDISNSDAILLVELARGECYLLPGEDFRALPTEKDLVEAEALGRDALASGDPDGAVEQIYERVNESFLSSSSAPSGSTEKKDSILPTVLLILLIVVIVVVILSAVDRARCSAYRARYYGVMTPPVAFRPILFWHGPGSGWYRRQWRPAQPSPPRTGGGSSTPRRSGSFGSTRGSGFGSSSSGSSTPRRSGNFGSTRGSGFGSSSGRSSFGGSRGGGFGGGSRGGGSFRGRR